MKFSDKVISKYDQLTKSEKKVANYYLEKMQEATEATLLEIAKQIGCGEATIVRFAKDLGYTSFKNMQFSLSMELDEEKPNSPDALLEEIRNNAVEKLDQTIERLDPEEINRAIELLSQAKNIFCIGSGTSGLSAEACGMRFIRNGTKCYYTKDEHFQGMLIAHAGEGDVVVAFSISGSSIDTIQCIEIAKKYGAKIIGVTSSPVSHLANLSDVKLITSKSENSYTAGNLISLTVHMFVANVLTTRLSMIDPERTAKARVRTTEVTGKKMLINV